MTRGISGLICSTSFWSVDLEDDLGLEIVRAVAARLCRLTSTSGSSKNAGGAFTTTGAGFSSCGLLDEEEIAAAAAAADDQQAGRRP